MHSHGNARIKAPQGQTPIASAVREHAREHTREHVREHVRENTREHVPVAARTTPGSACVLVVDDNEISRLVVVRTLEKLGYRADVAGNGPDALAAVAAVPGGHYAAVLMDCQMLGTDGYQAASEIRRLEGGGRHTPIIAMTACVATGDAERCLAAGMDDFLPKPVQDSALAGVLSSWVEDEVAAASSLPRLSAGRGPRLPGAARGSLDPKMIAELRKLQEASDGQFIVELVQTFLSATTTRLTELDDAIRQRDVSQIERLAHGLTGGGGTIGATVMAELSAALEAAARAGEIQTVRRLLPKLVAEFGRVRHALIEEFQDLSK